MIGEVLSPLKRSRERAERERRVFCARYGHTRLRDYFFGYHYCVRCGATLGDSLGSVFMDNESVFIHHMYLATHDPDQFAKVRGCNCPENVKKLKPRDLKLVPRYNALGYALRPPWKPKPGTVNP